MAETNFTDFLPSNKEYFCKNNDSNDSIEKLTTNNSNLKKQKHSKNKVFFFPLDSSNNHNRKRNSLFKQRKYTMEQEIASCITCFVPKLKPIKTKLVPSKFYLNGKKFDEKSKSCPCSDLEDEEDNDDEEEAEDEEISSKNTKPSIKNTRRDLEKIKSNKMLKALSKQVLTPKNTQTIGERILFEEEGEDIFPEIEPFEDMTPKCEYNINSFKILASEQIRWNNVNNSVKVIKKRVNSLSIIDALKRRSKN